MSENPNRKLHVLLSEADRQRFGFEHAGHSTLSFSAPGLADSVADLLAAGFHAFEVPASTRPDDAELQLGRRLSSFEEATQAESVFMFRQLVGG